MVKVLFVDDEPRLRQVWERVLKSQPDMECAGVMSRADGLAQTVIEAKPDVIVLDLTMPGEDPLSAMEALKNVDPPPRVIVYSGHSDEESIRAAFDAGAWGYIDKLASAQSVLDAIRRVHGGEPVFPPQV